MFRCWWPAPSIPRVFGRFSRHLRRRQGGQVRLVGVPAALGRSRPQRRAAHHLRCLPRPHGERCGVPARGAMAALHGAFLPERFQPRAGQPWSRAACARAEEPADAAAEGRSSASRQTIAILATAFSRPWGSAPTIGMSAFMCAKGACMATEQERSHRRHRIRQYRGLQTRNRRDYRSRRLSVKITNIGLHVRVHAH